MPMVTRLSAALMAVVAIAASTAFAQILPDDIVIPSGDESPTETPDDVPRLSRVALVVLDAGHGGEDAGVRAQKAGGETIFEKDIALAIARKAEARVAEETGARVQLTRSADVRLSAVERASSSNEARADLFLSIHLNSSPSPKARGFQVNYHDSSGAENGGSAPGAVLWSAAQRPFEAESARLAEIVRESLAAKVALPDRGVRRMPVPALEGAVCPAVLVEVGFLSNEEEAVALGTEAVQDAIAAALAEAVLRMDAVMALEDADE